MPAFRDQKINRTALIVGIAAMTFRAFAEDRSIDLNDVPPASAPVSAVVTSNGQKFEDVAVIGRNGDVLQFRHSAGIARLPITSFNDANLDLLFPGYLARLNDRKAKTEAQEQRRKKRASEESQLVEKKLRAAINDALHPADPETAQKEPLVAVLVFGREVYEVGDQPQLAVRIVNRSSKPVYLITGHNGTEPNCSLSFRDSAGHLGWWVEPNFCGLGFRTLRENSFVLVPPLESFAPRDLQFCEIDPRIFAIRFDRNEAFPQSGKFAVQFTYSTTNRRVRDYEFRAEGGIDPVIDPIIQRLFDQVPAVRLQSKPVEITLPPADPGKKYPLNSTL